MKLTWMLRCTLSHQYVQRIVGVGRWTVSIAGRGAAIIIVVVVIIEIVQIGAVLSTSRVAPALATLLLAKSKGSTDSNLGNGSCCSTTTTASCRISSQRLGHGIGR